ncbi:hypothetical protein NA57DRAFT_79894 [Rhizodiscina lignyota]|uniref:Inclusion body clearance protein IML2 n=1 Tax=Rhizodiscina lignyota TaxID=1504668 RepID=A0A9P4I8M8_9PEZI|nr:hypothetical protein NA57DRAFT_79894 [Rhizodiscina lignyota]
MLRSFLGSSRKANNSTQSLNAIEETQSLEDAMIGVLNIMNDDIVSAEESLSKGNSPFHYLGRGLSIFLRAVLGFEQDVMHEAAKTLGEAESLASEAQTRAHRHPDTSQAEIYPAGSEYALCIAESQLMQAVLGVLNESLTESIRGFYKLRKAYITLNSIADAETRYLARQSTSSVSTASTPASQSSTKLSTLEQPTASASSEVLVTATENFTIKEESSIDFIDAEEALGRSETIKAHYEGHLSIEGTVTSTAAQNIPKENGHLEPPAPPSATASTTSLVEEPIAQLFSSNPVDEFIHAGSNLCFGVLLLMISIIPPTFAMLLKIVGFRGDRERGLTLLWRATEAKKDINGAFAGLVLLGYYNSVIGFCDIFREDAYPRERCKALLMDMRTRFPKSRLWLLEEVRMLAGEKQLEKAVALMTEEGKSPLRQVQALQYFEKSLDCMYMHDYKGCSDSFQHCVTLNNWSHGLYYYIAGAATVEMYRQTKAKGDTEAAAKHASEATRLMKLVPQHAGKKRFMARQLPFDIFVCRKITKWEERAKAWDVDFVDAIGVSPMEEMIFFWNGYKRQRVDHLEKSLECLAWSESEHNPHWEKEGIDERAMLSMLRAVCLRHLKRGDEAKEILTSVIAHDWAQFKGGHKDNWPCPIAHYEMAVNLWEERDGTSDDKERLQECSKWLEKVANWESYDLDTRFGMRITTARETLKKHDIGGASAA